MSNTPLEQNGIDLDSVLAKVNALPQAGITPTGSITLTEEKSYDVTEKATAVVDMSATRARLAEAITAKGIDTLPDSSFDAMIANVGLISGGGFPSSWSYTTGEFTPSGDITSAIIIEHNLGSVPDIVYVTTDVDINSIPSNTLMTVFRAYSAKGLGYLDAISGMINNIRDGYFNNSYSNNYWHGYKGATSYNINLTESTAYLGSNVTATSATVYGTSALPLRAGIKYRWYAIKIN